MTRSRTPQLLSMLAACCALMSACAIDRALPPLLEVPREELRAAVVETLSAVTPKLSEQSLASLEAVADEATLRERSVFPLGPIKFTDPADGSVHACELALTFLRRGGGRVNVTLRRLDDSPESAHVAKRIRELVPAKYRGP